MRSRDIVQNLAKKCEFLLVSIGQTRYGANYSTNTAFTSLVIGDFTRSIARLQEEGWMNVYCYEIDLNEPRPYTCLLRIMSSCIAHHMSSQCLLQTTVLLIDADESTAECLPDRAKRIDCPMDADSGDDFSRPCDVCGASACGRIV